MTNECIEVGDANPDIAGVGILLSFGIQALLTIIISTFSIGFEWIIAKFDKGDMVGSKFLNRDVNTWNQVQKTAIGLLQTNSDVQTMTGISLLVTALAQINTLTFYHMHLVYDTVSFVSISNCAAMMGSLELETTAGIVRLCLIALWAVLYLIYTCLFGKRLQSWDYNTPGHCYNTHHLALPTSRHPYVDNIYIAITCFYVFSILYIVTVFLPMIEDIGMRRSLEHLRVPVHSGASVHSGRSSSSSLVASRYKRVSLQYRLLVLEIAFLQFPLHAYSVITLRRSNESLLIGGNTEQEWGFGQVSAMILLAPNVVGIVLGITDYLSWERRRQNHESTPDQPDIQMVEHVREVGEVEEGPVVRRMASHAIV